MRLGGFELKAVDSGHFRLDGGAMFGVVPRVLWEKTDPADENNRISMQMRALTKLSEKMLRNYQIECLPFREAVENHGIDPDSITDVIATHLHFDHAGGYTYYGDKGEIKLSFPDAVHYIQ